MLDANNLVTIRGGLVADPERAGKSDTILKLRLGVDRAGKDSTNPDNTSGYFPVTYFLDTRTQNGTFVNGQLANFKKGTQLAIVGRLVHERFTTRDGTKAERVAIIAESIGYAGPRDGAARDQARTDQAPAAPKPDDGWIDMDDAPASF